MNRLKSNNFNGITEFKNELKSSDIKIWIYTLLVKDLDKKHRENYDNIKFLKKENKDILIIEFNENLIGSFDEIKKRSVKYKRWRTTKRQRHSDGSKFPLLYLCLFLFCVL